MKRSIFILAILAISSTAKAQSLHVCNDNGTVLEIPATENKEITFDAYQRLIKFHNNGNIFHSFATDRIDSIALLKPSGMTELLFATEHNVTINSSEANEFDEITETIITDELIDESGDFIENYSAKKRVTITYTESGITIMPMSVTGITFSKTNNTHLTINSTISGMQYIVKGTSSNGSLKIYSDKKFQLMLGGVDLTNPSGPAINLQTGKTIYFTIGTGTVNNLCDGSTYAAPTIVSGVEEDQKGTLFSEGQIIFDGTGTLNVTSLGGHAICSDDYIRIRSGKINIISALKDGFHTNDLFRVGRKEKYSPEVSINATGDAIDCGKGEVIIEAGKLLLNSGGEAIKVSYEEALPDTLITPNATIKGGYIKIVTTGDKSSAIKTTGNYTQSGGIIHAEVSGNGSKIVNCDGTLSFTGGKLTGIATGTMHEADTTSAGGIKSEGDIMISNGEIAIKCTGNGAKAINGNANVTINGGTTTLLSTGDNYADATDSKKSRALTCLNLTQNGGTLLLNAHDKAISATSITITNGTIHAISTHDVKAVNVEPTQTGGWFMTKGEE